MYVESFFTWQAINWWFRVFKGIEHFPFSFHYLVDAFLLLWSRLKTDLSTYFEALSLTLFYCPHRIPIHFSFAIYYVKQKKRASNNEFLNRSNFLCLFPWMYTLNRNCGLPPKQDSFSGWNVCLIETKRMANI